MLSPPLRGGGIILYSQFKGPVWACLEEQGNKCFFLFSPRYKYDWVSEIKYAEKCFWLLGHGSKLVSACVDTGEGAVQLSYYYDYSNPKHLNIQKFQSRLSSNGLEVNGRIVSYDRLLAEQGKWKEY